MANQDDLLIAIRDLAKNDTAAGGLVDLIGKPAPVVRWGDRRQQDRPVIAADLTLARPEIMDRLAGTATFAILAEQQNLVDNPTFLGDVADRMAALYAEETGAARFESEGLDAVMEERTRRPDPALEQGRQRLDVEYGWELTR